MLIFFILCQCIRAADITFYVDPDAAGAGDGTSFADGYTSLSAFNSAEATDLVSAGNNYVVLLRSSAGTNDTTNFNWDDATWALDATHTVTLRQDDFPADGIWDDSAYIFEHDGGATSGMIFSEGFIHIDGMQVLVTVTGTDTFIGFQVINSNYPTRTHNFEKVIFRGNSSSSGLAEGIICSESDATINMINCVFYNFVNGADPDHRGARVTVGTLNLYNCISYNNYIGFYQQGGTLNATNCAVGNTTDDWFGTVLATTCIDDDDEDASIDPAGGDWANEFTDAANGDFSLVSGGNCIGNGTDDPSSGLYSDDIIGTARSSTWDIGAFEFVGSSGPPAIIYEILID
jgi:hypothetical protein